MDREVGEDDIEVENVGENAYRVSIDSYVSIDMQKIGEKEASKFAKKDDTSPESIPPHPTKAQVMALCEELETKISETEEQIKEVTEEIKQLKEFLWTVGKQCAQSEKWTRIFKAYSASLRQYLDNNSIPEIPAPSNSTSFSFKSSPKRK